MAFKCKLSGKRPLVGYNVSHAHNKTKRRQMPNVQRTRSYVPELNRWVRVRLSASTLRTITRKGLMAYLKSQGLTLRDVT
ncbi:MAG: 50S ribosomal protein L28 [Acidobacteriota bacterium]|nr:MAG: 50S ribosomal protein L28 [Acidobacteriota bacterium]